MRDRELWKIEKIRKPLWVKGNILHIQAAPRRMGRFFQVEMATEQ